MSNPVKFPAFDLSTPAGRRAAERDLVWTDHGFLRNLYQNFHWIEPGVMARSNQPSPDHIARYAHMGVKTILNARGKSDTGYYALEKEACERNDITLIDLRLRAAEQGAHSSLQTDIRNDPVSGAAPLQVGSR